MHERTDAGSQPSAREDGHRVALVLEGGGMRGVVSAGMVAALERLGMRDGFYELDGLLQTVLAPRRRGHYATFPSRRHMRQFEQMGFPVEEVARVIGMPLDEAQAHVKQLGLQRVRTTWMLMDRAPGDLDVIADDGVVTMILGRHM